MLDPTDKTSVTGVVRITSQLSADEDKPASKSNAAGTFPVFTIVNSSDSVWAGVTVTGPTGAITVA